MSSNLNQSEASRVVDQLLEGMRLAGVVTPGVAAVVRIWKEGRAAGEDDETTKQKYMAINQETITEADRQLAIEPNQPE